MTRRRPPTAALRAHALLLDQQDQENTWRKEKPTDIIAFNTGAEQHFVQWLTQRIRRSRAKAVEVSWVIANAAYDLDVSVLTIKRYVQKHTADRAPFKSNGKTILLRTAKPHPYNLPRQGPDTEK